MKPVLNDATVMRIERTTGKPVSRSMDSAINECLDELDDLKAQKDEKSEKNPDTPCFMESNCSEEEEVKEKKLQ